MNRRTFLHRGALAGGAFLAGTPFFLPSVRPFSSLRPVERVYVSMGTSVRFLVYHDDERDAVAAIHEAQAIVQEVHRLMSVEEPQSELSRWNFSSVGLDKPLNPLTTGAIDEAVKFTRDTDRRFDPTMGSILADGRPAAYGEFAPDWTDAWDSEERRLSKVHPGLRLDLGGSAKGWAVDRAVETLQRNGISSALVNAGGDLRVTGPPPGEDFWRVGIRDPLVPDETFCELQVTDVAVATSGGYEPHGSKIVDPRDGRPVTFPGSATILAPSCGAADCLSTAAVVDPRMPLNHPGAHSLLARPSEDGLLVDHDPDFPRGMVTHSEAAGNRVRFQSKSGP